MIFQRSFEKYLRPFLGKSFREAIVFGYILKNMLNLVSFQTSDLQHYWNKCLTGACFRKVELVSFSQIFKCFSIAHQARLLHLGKLSKNQGYVCYSYRWLEPRKYCSNICQSSYYSKILTDYNCSSMQNRLQLFAFVVLTSVCGTSLVFREPVWM